MDLSALRDRPDMSPVSVSELNEDIKRTLESESRFSHLTVRGEISNFVRHSSGHLYFTLKDEGGQIRAVMFRSSAARLTFLPADGMKVIVSASLSVYGKNGSYQLYVSSVRPDGVGALYLAYERLKEKLTEEGLFDEERKRPVPYMPRRIGVITSPTGAAVRDIIRITGRRFPLTEIYLYPSLVQGDGAEANLTEALRYFENSHLCDVIIIGRGGGSIEDLWAFNGETLARTVAAMTIPVISAVGHETDFTICDFVADLRAPTPSAAAEMATPDMRDILQYLDTVPDRCRLALAKEIKYVTERFGRLKKSSCLRSPEGLLKPCAEKLAAAEKAVTVAAERILSDADGKLKLLTGKTQALSPLSVLTRGYAIVTREGISVKGTADVSVGDTLCVTLSDGDILSTVSSVTEKRRKHHENKTDV